LVLDLGLVLIRLVGIFIFTLCYMGKRGLIAHKGVIFQGLLFQEVLLCHQLSSVLLGIGFSLCYAIGQGGFSVNLYYLLVLMIQV
jgi:hypothetical protein